MTDAAAPLATLEAAWRWWIAELAAMIPSHLRAAELGRSAIDIRVGRHDTIIERTAQGIGERYVEQSSIECLDDESWEQIAALSDGRSARLLLSAPDIHVGALELPKQARGRLRQAVALQLAEIAPIDPAELSWTAVAVATTGERLSASLVMAKRGRIAALLAQFEQRGLPAPRVSAILPDGRCVNLPISSPAAPAPGRVLPSWAIAMGLLASIPVTTYALASALTWSNERVLDALGDAVAAKSADERRWGRAEAARAALAPVAREPSLAQLLDELASRLPPEMSLASIERGAGISVTLMVEADDPELVRTVLGRDPQLRLSEVDEAPLDDGRMRLTYQGVLR